MRLRFHTVAAEDRAWQVGRLWKGFRTLTGPHQARSSIIGSEKHLNSCRSARSNRYAGWNGPDRSAERAVLS